MSHDAWRQTRGVQSSGPRQPTHLPASLQMVVPPHSPQFPLHPSGPQSRSAHCGAQTHCPWALQLAPSSQPGEHSPPQPSAPHDLPAQFGVQAHWPSAVHLALPEHEPQLLPLQLLGPQTLSSHLTLHFFFRCFFLRSLSTSRWCFAPRRRRRFLPSAGRASPKATARLPRNATRVSRREVPSRTDRVNASNCRGSMVTALSSPIAKT